MNLIKTLLIVATVIAIGSATDYTTIETISESVLLKSNTNRISQVDVSIGTTAVYIDYRTYASTSNEVMKDIATVVGCYFVIVDEEPNVGDLHATVRDINGKKVGTWECKNEWVNGKDVDDLLTPVIQAVTTIKVT